MFEMLNYERTSNKEVANDLMARFAFLIGYYDGEAEQLDELVPSIFSGSTEELDWSRINKEYEAGVSLYSSTL